MSVSVVTRSVATVASLEACWRALTEVSALSAWFADTDTFGPCAETRFDFGDGDFFRATSVDIEPIRAVRFRWRFMDLGAWSRVEYRLKPEGTGAKVTVIELGDFSPDGAAELSDGWEDFLCRYARYLATGTNQRYGWNETIAMEALLGVAAELTEGLESAEHRRRCFQIAFPGAEPTLVQSGLDCVELRFRDAAWNGVETRAEIHFIQRGHAMSVRVEHGGWKQLPVEMQVVERRRFANLWANALRQLEESHG